MTLAERLEKAGKARARANFVAENPHLANDKYYEEKPELSMTYRSYRKGHSDLAPLVVELAEALKWTAGYMDDLGLSAKAIPETAIASLEAYLEGGKK